MKTKLSVLVALAAAISSPGAISQEQQQQPPPPTPSQPGVPAQPATPPEAGRPPLPPPPPPPIDRRDDDHRGRRGGPGDRDRDGDRFRDSRESRPERVGEPQPYLGVMTSPVPPAVSAQVGLPEGFGLLVQEVLPDSPAAKAGLQKHDILKLFNDQQLVEPGQLATLVRAAGKDASISLTVIRKGQEQKLSTTLGERVQPVRRPFEGGFGPGMMFSPRDGMEKLEKFHERLRENHERLRENHERLRENQERFRDQMNERQKGPQGLGGPADVPSTDILREARPGGGRNITIYTTDAQTKVDGSKAHLTLKDQDGEIEVFAENGKRMMTAKNPKGEVVFSGPVNTDEERKAVPEQFRSKLDKIQVRQKSDADGGRGDAFAGISPDVRPLPDEGEVQ